MQKFKELGPERTLTQLRKTLLILLPNPPGDSTLRHWSSEGKWRDEAAKYDIEQAEIMQQSLSASPSVLAARIEYAFHAKAALARMADSFAQRVIEWAEGDGSATKHIQSANDARTLAETTIKLVGQVEVLEGRVSDRKEEEKTITVHEVQNKATSQAEMILARAAEAALSMQRNQDGTFEEVH